MSSADFLTRDLYQTTNLTFLCLHCVVQCFRGSMSVLLHNTKSGVVLLSDPCHRFMHLYNCSCHWQKLHHAQSSPDSCSSPFKRLILTTSVFEKLQKHPVNVTNRLFRFKLLPTFGERERSADWRKTWRYGGCAGTADVAGGRQRELEQASSCCCPGEGGNCSSL